MQIPKFHETFLPILKVLADANIIHRNELKKRVCDQFYKDLPKELLELKTKTGDTVILNRIGWGIVYLKQAAMIRQPERAMIQITDKGKEILKEGKLSFSAIRHDKDFLEHRLEREQEKGAEIIDENASPQDLIDAGVRAIEEQTKAGLLDQLHRVDPYYFQSIILVLLEKMGYGDFVETPKSNDGGVDGIINQDKLGLEKIYIQAKRYTDNKVREGEIRNFIGAMSRDTNKGIFATTSTFDEKAIQKAKDATQKIILIDGAALVDLMYKYGVGVQAKYIYEIKHVDEDFFEEE